MSHTATVPAPTTLAALTAHRDRVVAAYDEVTGLVLGLMGDIDRAKARFSDACEQVTNHCAAVGIEQDDETNLLLSMLRGMAENVEREFAPPLPLPLGLSSNGHAARFSLSAVSGEDDPDDPEPAAVPLTAPPAPQPETRPALEPAAEENGCGTDWHPDDMVVCLGAGKGEVDELPPPWEDSGSCPPPEGDEPASPQEAIELAQALMDNLREGDEQAAGKGAPPQPAPEPQKPAAKPRKRRKKGGV